MIYNAALYCRLSKDDNNVGDSSSIVTQKDMLTRYAHEQNFCIYDVYIDDGYSGTNFDRPAFQKMKQDIESGKVNLVITKDLSRLGRDYIISGQLIEEYFPKHNVRYIAITDGFDSINKYNDIAPFKNVVNELYARDISKKIRSAFETKMKEGKFIGNFAPYGYKKDSEDKNKLIINEETAPIVQYIFKLAEEGYRPIDIARALNEKHILPPALYRCSKNPKLNVDNYSKRKEWTSPNIQKMLKNTTYIGHTAQHKTTKISFKSKVTLANQKKDWIIVENTHEPIIDKQTFEIVQKMIVSRKNPPKSDFKNIFSGIAICADCGSNMSTTGTRKKDSKYNLVCGKYKLYGSKECTNHFIDYDVLYKLVLTNINKHLKITPELRKKILSQLEQTKNNSTGADKRFIELNKRKTEIQIIIQKLYEDNYLGRINEDHFNMVLNSLTKEETQIDAEMSILTHKSNESEYDNYNRFFKLLDNFSDLTELNQDVIRRLIDVIYIYQGSYRTINGIKSKEQKIVIKYKYIGKSIIA